MIPNLLGKMHLWILVLSNFEILKSKIIDDLGDKGKN